MREYHLKYRVLIIISQFTLPCHSMQWMSSLIVVIIVIIISSIIVHPWIWWLFKIYVVTQTCVLHSLHCELVGPYWDAVNKLHGAPETVELDTLVHVHHTIAGQWATPDGVIQEASHTGEDDFEHGQTTAQPLFGQQVSLTSDGNLLKVRGRVWVGNSSIQITEKNLEYDFYFLVLIQLSIFFILFFYYSFLIYVWGFHCCFFAITVLQFVNYFVKLLKSAI